MKTTTASAWACLLLWTWSTRVSGTYYRAVDYQSACFVESSGVSAVAKSKLICAASCTMTRCSHFRFLGGNCTLFNQGLASVASGRTYRKIDIVSTDVAFNKPALASDYHAHLVPGRAVDGDLRTQFHSQEMVTPWWRVDLGGNYCIQAVDVQPHLSVPGWFRSAEIRAGVSAAEWDFSGYALIAFFPGPYSGVGRLVFTPSGPQEARYISIQVFATEFLNIQDVRVMALVMSG